MWTRRARNGRTRYRTKGSQSPARISECTRHRCGVRKSTTRARPHGIQCGTAFPIQRDSAPCTAPRETNGVSTPSMSHSGHQIRAPPPSRDSRRARRTRPGRAPASLTVALYSSQILTPLVQPYRPKLPTDLPKPFFGRSGSFWYQKKALELYFQLQTSNPIISLISGSENGKKALASNT